MRWTEKVKDHFLLLCSVLTNLFLDQLLFFYFLGVEVPASSLREQFSVALTRAVGLCDPGIREVCLAGGRWHILQVFYRLIDPLLII